MNYFFIGDQPELKKQAIEKKKKELLDPSSQDLNFNIFYAGEEDLRRVRDAFYTLPFLSKARLVVIKDFHRASVDEKELVLSFLKKPARSTCLILDAGDDAKNKDGMSDIMRLTSVSVFKEMSGAGLIAWINKELSASGKKIAADASELLRELAGGDPTVLKAELEKLDVYTGKRREITRKDVEELVGKSVIDTVFELADAALKKDINKALGISHDLLSLDRKKPHEILGMLAWQFRSLLKVKRALKGRPSLSGVSFELGMRETAARRMAKECSNFSSSLIERKLEAILSTDLAIKSGEAATPELALELALVGLCRD